MSDFVKTAPFRRASSREPAFTRTELLLMLAVLSLLLAIVLPALAHERARSARIICANNLRQIGMGFQLWGNDHGGLAPYEVDMVEGGTRVHPLAANTWFHFAWISNELASPKMLLCPSDSGTAATEFSGDPKKGYLNPNFANQATTYFLTERTSQIDLLVQAGDRNLKFNAGLRGCSRFNAAWAINLPYQRSDEGWTNALHGTEGNFLSSDGSVEQAVNERFREALKTGNFNDGGSLHFAVPR